MNVGTFTAANNSLYLADIKLDIFHKFRLEKFRLFQVIGRNKNIIEENVLSSLKLGSTSIEICTRSCRRIGKFILIPSMSL